jgi:hypothetical protein
LLLAGAALVGTACFGTQGPPLPDLSAEQTQVERRAERLRLIEELMMADLEQFESLRRQFIEADPELYNPPFPLDLFKHVAVDCLNEPWDPNRLEASDHPAGSTDSPLGCSPEFHQRLVVALDEQVPERSEDALELLHVLDGLRQLRGKLRHRFARVAPIVEASRNLLAARRADLRQLRASYERRRTEYTSEHWRQLQQALDEHEQILQSLQARIERLDEAWPTWPPRLDESIRTLYLELSKLPPNDRSP